jgi:SAM-dependent methyltransferase
MIRLFAARFLVTGVFFGSLAFGQKPEYDFYPEFRNVFVPQLRSEVPSLSEEAIVARYAAKLRAEAIPDREISRRTTLIRSGKPPGAALDYAMGQGRNAIYLAGLGWRVSGFDPAGAAVAIAQQRAKELGLTLDTAAVRDSQYDFGKERFDLILFSWSMPLIPVKKVLDSLKPGGMVVMECAADYVGRNGMLKLFDDLQIVRYEIVRAKADFYDRAEVDVLRMIAVKPR